MSKVKPPLGVISQASQIVLEEKGILNLQFQNLKSHFLFLCIICYFTERKEKKIVQKNA